jgi:hypothetical protein
MSTRRILTSIASTVQLAEDGRHDVRYGRLERIRRDVDPVGRSIEAGQLLIDRRDFSRGSSQVLAPRSLDSGSHALLDARLDAARGKPCRLEQALRLGDCHQPELPSGHLGTLELRDGASVHVFRHRFLRGRRAGTLLLNLLTSRSSR